MAALQRYQLYIDGAFRDAAGGETFRSASPFTGEDWAELAAAQPGDVDAAIATAQDILLADGVTATCSGQGGRPSLRVR